MGEGATILLVDDDRGLVDVLSMSLEDEGFEVLTAVDGRQGWSRFQADEGRVDLAILDLLMPEIDGLHLCRMIRERCAVPVILLTSRDHEMDKVLGLEMGADDYVTKPFSTRELIARIGAALRRARMAGPDVEATGRLRRGPLAMDRERREVSLSGAPVELTVTEFDLLWALMARAGRVLDRDRIIDLVYGEDIVVADRTIDTFIKRLRQKLSQLDPSFQPIETIRGVGYKFGD